MIQVLKSSTFYSSRKPLTVSYLRNIFDVNALSDKAE